jgi:hypothetical protein
VRSLPLLLAMASASISLAVLAPSCSNQGEGERCSQLGDNGGNDECQSGLQCTAASAIGPNAGGVDRCCPVDLRQATTTGCMTGGSASVADAAPPGQEAAPPEQDAGSEGAASDGPTADAPGG